MRAILVPVKVEENIQRVRVNCEIVRELGVEACMESGTGVEDAVDVGVGAVVCEEKWSAENQMAEDLLKGRENKN